MQNINKFVYFEIIVCSSGSLEYGGKCYEYRSEYLSRIDASAKCNDLGSRLTPADNSGLNDFLQKMTKVRGATSWIGVVQSAYSGKYVTCDCPRKANTYNALCDQEVSSTFWKDPQSIKVSQS